MPSFLIFTQPKPQRHISRSQLLQHYIVSSTLGQIKASHATNDCNKKGGNWVEVSWKLDNIYRQKSLCSCMKDLLFWHNYTTRKFIRIGPQDEHMPWLFGSSLSWFWHIVFFLSCNERLYPRWRWENRRVWGGRESLLEPELISIFQKLENLFHYYLHGRNFCAYTTQTACFDFHSALNFLDEPIIYVTAISY